MTIVFSDEVVFDGGVLQTIREQQIVLETCKFAKMPSDR